MRLINIKAALFLLCGLVFAVSCDDDDSDFKGRDNYITSFCLVKGETTLTASILDDSLKIVVPEVQRERERHDLSRSLDDHGLGRGTPFHGDLLRGET